MSPTSTSEKYNLKPHYNDARSHAPMHCCSLAAANNTRPRPSRTGSTAIVVEMHQSYSMPQSSNKTHYARAQSLCYRAQQKPNNVRPRPPRTASTPIVVRICSTNHKKKQKSDLILSDAFWGHLGHCNFPTFHSYRTNERTASSGGI
jgi:hypothetical protein